MRFDIIAAVVGFVLQTGEKIVAAFLDKQFGKDNQHNLPTKIENARKDTRVRQAEIDYYNRREAREKELLQIQDLRLKTDIQIAAVQAEREERALQLKQEELEDRRKLSALYLDLIREKTAKDIEIKKQEIQAIFDQQKWPGILSRDEVQRIFIEEQQKPRLLMLVPPPDISEDFPISFRDSLNKEIRNQLKIFLEKYYPLQGDLCPVEFYGKYFERSVFDAEVKQLETILSAVPTAIIYTDITDHEVYFNIRFWGLQEPVSLSFEPWNWEEVKRQLEEAGNDENQSFRAIRKTIVTLHKLLAAFLADWYYLNIDPNYEPQLFNIEADIPTDWTSKLHSQLSSISQHYRAIYNNDLQLIADFESSKKRKWRCINTLIEHSKSVLCLAINPNGKTFASSSCDHTIQIWNLHQGEVIGTFTGHSDYVRAIAFSPDGQILASGSDDKKIKLWFAKTGTTFTGYSANIYSIAFSPDGKCIATGSGDGNIKIWNIDTEELICQLNGHTSAITSIIIDNNGRQLISASRDHTIKIWDIKTGLAIYSLEERSNWVNAVAISPNSKTLASGSNDKTIKLWDLYNGELIHTFLGHNNPVSSVAFSPDGQLLVSGSQDNTIKLWHLSTKELINTLSGHSGTVNSVAFSIDGKNIISGSTDNTIKIWGYE
ncbi:WD40 repeat domain-containing protein [Nostoc spongiaeforme FACHB-130]|uniref:WD40 repeat domain-containing protein n=1 Tax=Nostoc spongiaeforme FACHB-130 TaxID=1357510 RepID=A0ABR8FRM7_9NOSO|nr:WD40 repeat domain-containing protein [Nostoc spongiaeforme]MBD2593799.1 WD40 repeat domain-containing protein [Nostoc spongiaeforme FACHB-130]